MRSVIFWAAVGLHLSLCLFTNDCGTGPASASEHYSPFHPWVALFVASLAMVVYAIERERQKVERAKEAKQDEQALRKHATILNDEEREVVKAMREGKAK